MCMSFAKFCKKERYNKNVTGGINNKEMDGKGKDNNRYIWVCRAGFSAYQCVTTAGLCFPHIPNTSAFLSNSFTWCGDIQRSCHCNQHCLFWWRGHTPIKPPLQHGFLDWVEKISARWQPKPVFWNASSGGVPNESCPMSSISKHLSNGVSFYKKYIHIVLVKKFLQSMHVVTSL